MATIKLFNNHIRVPFIILVLAEALIFLLSVYSLALLGFINNSSINDSMLSEFDDSNIAMVAFIYTLVMLMSMTALGHYQSQQYSSTNILINTLVRCVVALSIGAAVLTVLCYLFQSINIGRELFTISILISLMGVVAIRVLFIKLVDNNGLKRNVLIIGSGLMAQTLILEKGGGRDGISYTLKGCVPVRDECTKIAENKILNVSMTGIHDYAMAHNINEIILAIDDRRKYYPIEELLKCKFSGIKIVEPVSFLEQEQGKVNLEMLNSSWVIFNSGFYRNGLEVLSNRVFDVVTSLFIFIIMSPILLITAFFISAESRFTKAVFYKQTRIGLNGKEFTLYKFRSMTPDAEKDGVSVWASKNDCRITMVGRFIRKTRVDELPQIINILKGEMRLVGPRPERPDFVNKLSVNIPFYNKRHTVKPGLAGWAQLKYPYGATERDAYEKLQYDLYYVKNHNIIMDFFILLQTVEIVLMGKGAR
jgi:sugar transferase (PEP-CTERM system associated)